MKDRPNIPLPLAFTLRELVVGMALVGLLVFLAMAALPRSGGGLTKGRFTYVLSNMKQLYLATQQMTLDSQTTDTPPNTRWTCTNGRPLGFAEWAELLVSNNYLSKENLTKLLQKTYYGTPTRIITVYAVGDFDPADTVLLGSANWQGPKATNLAKSPLGDSDFAVFRQDGSGAILPPRRCQDMRLIGSGGKFNFLPLQ